MGVNFAIGHGETIDFSKSIAQLKHDVFYPLDVSPHIRNTFAASTCAFEYLVYSKEFVLSWATKIFCRT